MTRFTQTQAILFDHGPEMTIDEWESIKNKPPLLHGDIYCDGRPYSGEGSVFLCRGKYGCQRWFCACDGGNGDEHEENLCSECWCKYQEFTMSSKEETMQKLSERLMDMARMNLASDFRAVAVAAFESAAELAEAYEAEVEKRAAVVEAKTEKRIAELEQETARLRECMRIAGLECFMREGPPEAVAKHMGQIIESYTKRVAELEHERMMLQGSIAMRDEVSDRHCKIREELANRVMELKSKLAWTPVSAGLPTEPGWYVFFNTHTVMLYQRKASERWPWVSAVGTIATDMRAWDAFRRIELPEEK